MAGPALRSVHQFLPNLAPRDAVGNHTREVHKALQQRGMAGGLWAGQIDSTLASLAKPYRDYPGRRSSGASRLNMYHCSVGSGSLTEFLLKRPEPLMLYYHNITPATFFDVHDPTAAAQMRLGREELRRLAARVRIALAASNFNAQELRHLGIADVRVMVPYASPGLTRPPDANYLRGLRAGKKGVDLLFVGRVAPHKGHKHLLRVAAALRAGAPMPVRVFAVGARGPEAYMAYLKRLHERLGLENVVFFTGSLQESQLAAHYANADLFVCLSEHEGFCIPLLEAMRAALPVVAYDGGAVGETLGGSGVLLTTLDPVMVAEVVARVFADDVLSQQLRASESQRAGELDGFDRATVLVRAVNDIDN